jgi:nuclear transport factor 2 (NTF2) superfamily protein
MAAPIPPFTRESAIVKVRMAEDGWNSRDPHRVSLAYTEDSRWRNRAEFINGRAEIVAFLTRKWKQGARLPPDKGTLGLRRQPNCGAVCLRVA